MDYLLCVQFHMDLKKTGMNEHEEKMMADIFYENSGCGKNLLYCCIVIVLILVLSACKTQYVPVETIRTEYINRTDTVKQTDSIFTNKETIIKEADNALIAELGLQLKDNERAILILQKELQKQVSKESEHKTDTIIKTDSIQVPYPVERKLSKWEQIKMDIGGIAIGGFIGIVVIIIATFLIRRYRKP